MYSIKQTGLSPVRFALSIEPSHHKIPDYPAIECGSIVSDTGMWKATCWGKEVGSYPSPDRAAEAILKYWDENFSRKALKQRFNGRDSAQRKLEFQHATPGMVMTRIFIDGKWKKVLFMLEGGEEWTGPDPIDGIYPVLVPRSAHSLTLRESGVLARFAKANGKGWDRKLVAIWEGAQCDSYEREALMDLRFRVGRHGLKLFQA